MTTTIETSTTTSTIGTLQHVPPGTLLLERNIRDAKPDPELVASIRDRGVLQPVTARLNDDGKLVLRMGYRRTLAAIEAERDTIPVYVAGHVDDTDADEIDRIIEQRDENTHRTGLTTAEDASAVAQLAAFGLSADEIAAQARIAEDRVHTALKVTRSKLAKGAIDRYADLTLDQAAAVAEFEDDAETFKGLVATALQRPGQFAHVLQQKRDDRDLPILMAAIREELENAGVRVLDSGLGSAFRVDHLKDKKSGKELTAETHAKCPGRAATVYLANVYVDTDGNTVNEVAMENRHEEAYRIEIDRVRTIATNDGHDPAEVVDDDEIWDSIDPRKDLTEERRGVVDTWYCLDPETHGHVYRWGSTASSSPAKKPAAEMSDAEREKARAARQLVIDNNKAWDSAEVVRREWLQTFAVRKTPPKGTAAFIATALGTDPTMLNDYGAGQKSAELLGIKTTGYGRADITKALTGASENRALMVALVQILTCYESIMSRDSWRGNGKTSAAGRYLRFLEAAGYELSDVEQYAVSSKTA